MPWTRVQAISAHRSTSSNTQALAFGSNVVAGNVLVAFVGWNGASGTASVADSQGNTWTQATSAAGSGATTASEQAFTAVAGSSGACTVTATTSATWPQADLHIAEESGLDTTSGRVSANGTDTSDAHGNVSQTPSVTLTVGTDEAIFASATDLSANGVAAGYTRVGTVTGVMGTTQKNDPTSAGSLAVVMGNASTSYAMVAFSLKLGDVVASAYVPRRMPIGV